MDVKNVNRSTILHEAAVHRNIEALKLFVRKYGHEPLLIKNIYGETPLFTAAAFGSTEVVKYLASQPNQMTDGGKQLKDIHRIRDDGHGISILYVAIRGQHFDTALELLRLDESLAGLKNKEGMTGLHLLASMPTAFRSRYRMDLWKLFFYTYLPAGGVHIEAEKNDHQVHSRDLESGQSNNRRCFSLNLCKGQLGRIRTEKRKHKLAFQLAKKLIQIDTTWLSTEDQPCHEVEGSKEHTIVEEHDTWENHYHSVADANSSTRSSSFAMGTSTQVQSPLLLAAASGIIEIVKEMIHFCPQVVAHVNSKKQNILHVAAMYRQREVFEVVVRKKVSLHSRHGALFWRNLLRGRIPTARGDTMVPTCRGNNALSLWLVQRFQKQEDTRRAFQTDSRKTTWGSKRLHKMTAQACSTVAVLIATVVYAAAYTLPGGNNQHGRPMFENFSAFALFTVTDYIAVGCSLTSVVMFLSILVAPLQLRDFHHTLPRTLTMGFTFLFLSVAATMIAFTSTVFLTIHYMEQQRWFRTFCFSLVSAIVSIFAMIQFPLYVSFRETLMNIIKLPKKLLKCVKL
ncbi:hypothetical protein LWI28_018034 [Acer negundo]|uniref:PGG domain-containing protein n=1 Tax=Acer negundo TaxID=4023 RepID=A0AAD5JFY5_ACENE|nr:hypothetical protein LWI28_018034 [Acer negundo]